VKIYVGPSGFIYPGNTPVYKLLKVGFSNNNPLQFCLEKYSYLFLVLNDMLFIFFFPVAVGKCNGPFPMVDMPQKGDRNFLLSMIVVWPSCYCVTNFSCK